MRRLLSGTLAVILVVACDPGEEPGDSMEPGGDGSTGDDAGDTTESGGGTDDAGIEGPIEGRPCPPESPLSADNFGVPFVLTWCAGCHNSALPEAERAGAPVGIDLDSLETTREHLLRIYERSADDNVGMPPSGGPSAEERALLGDWLACGAPE